MSELHPVHPAALAPDELLQHCDVRRQRRSGPGGQHRNKVETAVIITHRDSGCIGEASERRSQEQNRQNAILRLRIELALEIRRPIDLQAEPSTLWRSRLKGARISVNANHDDFPALLAESLDCLSAFDWEVGRASAWLGTSNSQLVRFLKLERRAFEALNAARQDRGLCQLR